MRIRNCTKNECENNFKEVEFNGELWYFPLAPNKDFELFKQKYGWIKVSIYQFRPFKQECLRVEELVEWKKQ